MKDPIEVIMDADVEFLHGVPVHPNKSGAEAIVNSLAEAGYSIVYTGSPETWDTLPFVIHLPVGPPERIISIDGRPTGE
jgi:hypothetical protein